MIGSGCRAAWGISQVKSSEAAGCLDFQLHQTPAAMWYGSNLDQTVCLLFYLENSPLPT